MEVIVPRPESDSPSLHHHVLAGLLIRDNIHEKSSNTDQRSVEALRSFVEEYERPTQQEEDHQPRRAEPVCECD